MAEVNLEFLGRMLLQVIERLDRVEARLARIEDTMSTREQLNRLWRVVEGRIELGRDELLDTTTAIENRLNNRIEEIEARLRRLEEAQEQK